MINRALRIKNMYIDKTYKEYKKSVNMGFKALLKWYKNPKSQKIISSRRYTRISLKLLRTPPAYWTMEHVRQAKNLISMLNKLKNQKNGSVIKEIGYSKRDLMLKNLGFNTKV